MHFLEHIVRQAKHGLEPHVDAASNFPSALKNRLVSAAIMSCKLQDDSECAEK